MSLDALLNLGCTIVRVTQDGAADEYGNPTDTTLTAATRCYIEQRNATENTNDRSTTSEDWLLMLPAGTAVDATDRVTVDGYGTFEVIGPPWPVRNPRADAISHVEATVRRTV